MPSRTVNIIVRATGATAASRQLRGVAQSLSLVDKRGRAAGRSVDGVGAAASRAKSSVIDIAKRASVGMLGLGATAAVVGVKFNAMIEQQTTAFSSLIGGTKEANKYVQGLYTLAKNTPFQFEDVLRGTRTMIAYGASAQDAKDIFTGLGNAIATTGGSTDAIRRSTLALGQIQSAGVLHAQDLNQLVNAGVISVSKVATRMGFKSGEAFRKDMKKNKINSTDFLKTVRDMWEHDPLYSGAALKQSKTFFGQMEKLQDYTKQTLGVMFEPLYQAMKRKVLPEAVRISADFTRIWRRKRISFAEKLDLSKASLDRHLTPLMAAIGDWWRRNHMGRMLLGAFEDALTYVGNRLPGVVAKVLDVGWDAWWNMGYKGKAVTAWMLLGKLGIRRKLLSGAAAILGGVLFGGKLKGKGGRGGGNAGVMNVTAGVVNVYGGAGVPGKGKPGGGLLGKAKKYLGPAALARGGLAAAPALAAVGGLYGLYQLGRRQHGPKSPQRDRAQAAAGLQSLNPQRYRTPLDSQGFPIGAPRKIHPLSSYQAGANRMSAVLGHMAAGGMVGRSGPYEVGEHGSERVWLPKGSQVQSHGGTDYAPIHITLQVNERTLATAVHRAALRKKAVR